MAIIYSWTRRSPSGCDWPQNSSQRLRMLLHGHYIAESVSWGDFLFLGPPDSPAYLQLLEGALAVCRELGMPVALEKVEGPATRLAFLGINIDSQAFKLSLPLDKLALTSTLVQSWLGRQAVQSVPPWAPSAHGNSDVGYCTSERHVPYASK